MPARKRPTGPPSCRLPRLPPSSSREPWTGSKVRSCGSRTVYALILTLILTLTLILDPKS